MSIFSQPSEIIDAPLRWTTVIKEEFKPLLFTWFKEEFCEEVGVRNNLCLGRTLLVQSTLTEQIKNFNSSGPGPEVYEVQLDSLVLIKPRSRTEYTVEFRVKHVNDKESCWDNGMMNILTVRVKITHTKREGNFIFVDEL